MERTLPSLGLAVALAVVACDDDHTSRVDELMSAATADKEPPPPPPPERFTEVPTILVDTLGAVIGPRRAKDLDKDKGRAELAKIVADIPFGSDPVVVKALPKAKVPDVVETVWALGKGGATKIILRTDARDDLPNELLLTPQHLVTDPKPCSVVAMVTETADTGVWSLKGGGGIRKRKGLAGPDLSNTGKTIEDWVARCESDTAFFSTAANMPWEHAFAIGGLFRNHDKNKKIDKLVLLGIEPVAGRPVELRK
jgi:hypothetical protein